MADIPRAYKLNKEKRAADENGKFLYYFYDRKKLTSVALPEEQFDKLVEMDREYYNLERRENDHKTTFKKSANTNGYKKIDIEKDDFTLHTEKFKRTLELADILGAENIRLFSFFTPPFLISSTVSFRILLYSS